MMNQKVNKVKVGNDLKESMREVVDSLGGFGKFIKSGDTVLIKPNYNTADASPASTAPDFLRIAVELIYEAGAAKVIVGESSTFTIKDHTITTKETLTEGGVYDLEKLSKPPEIMIFDEHEWVNKQISGAKYQKSVSFPKIMTEVDKIILLPCAKTHSIANFTGALKIVVGFMKPKERIKLHMGKMSEKVVEMNLLYQPDLIIMDARKCFITGGPSKGEVREPGLIFASGSRVDIDIEEVKTIQKYKGNSLADKNAKELPQIKYARELGIQ